MMMKTILCAIGVAALGTAGLTAGPSAHYSNYGKNPAPSPEPSILSCQSDYFDYDVLDIDYIFDDYDASDLGEGHGVSIGMKKLLTECTYMTLGGSWRTAEGIGGSDDIDFWSFSLGTGLIFPLHERVHLLGEIGGFYQFENSGDNGQFGGYVGPLLRIGLTRNLEVFGSALYFLEESGDNAMGYTAGAVLRLTEGLGLKGAWSHTEDEQEVLAGLRFAF